MKGRVIDEVETMKCEECGIQFFARRGGKLGRCDGREVAFKKDGGVIVGRDRVQDPTGDEKVDSDWREEKVVDVTS